MDSFLDGMSIYLKIHLAGDRAEDRGEKKSNEDRQNDDDDHFTAPLWR
jgi:hypothetical protein